MKKTFVKYVSSNIIGMIGVSCYILADTFFVAKALGTIGLASLNFSISIFSILQGFGLMIGVGGATDFSIQAQKDDQARRNHTFMHALILGGITSVLFLIVGIWFTAPLGKLLGADATTLPLVTTYLTTILCFAPFFLLNNILLAFVRNDKNPKLSMIAMLASSLANIVLDYVFMFPLSMGIFGAAFATGLSPIISLAILSLHFIKRKHSFGLCKCRLQLKKMFRILSLGISSFVGEIASAISLIVFNLILIRLAGNTGVAAYGVVANIALIVTAIFVGISQGTQPIASKCYGAQDFASLKKIMRYVIGTTISFAIIIYAILFCFADSIIAVFNSENDSALAFLALDGTRIYFIGYFFAGINIVFAAFLSAVTHTKQALLIALFRSCLFLLPIVFGFSMLLGMTGIWLSFVITEGIVFLFTLLFIRKLTHSFPHTNTPQG